MIRVYNDLHEQLQLIIKRAIFSNYKQTFVYTDQKQIAMTNQINLSLKMFTRELRKYYVDAEDQFHNNNENGTTVNKESRTLSWSQFLQ